MVIASVGDPAEVFHSHQGNPRCEQVQSHFPARQSALDRHMHGIDVRAHFGGIEILQDQIEIGAAIGDDRS